MCFKLQAQDYHLKKIMTSIEDPTFTWAKWCTYVGNFSIFPKITEFWVNNMIHVPIANFKHKLIFNNVFMPTAILAEAYCFYRVNKNRECLEKKIFWGYFFRLNRFHIYIQVNVKVFCPRFWKLHILDDFGDLKYYLVYQ